MKIGITSTPAADAATLSRANAEAGAAAAKARGATQAPSSDASSVQISSAASGLMAQAATPEFDTAKVERIRQSIADGSFKIDAAAIADKLISNAQELLGAAKR
ncbi:MAG: flagellar biosynthesis anti-sigma factor FlgM [Methylibium sp.]|nr:flagellar biosynthesis anti-sigma factor FlgM [Methylibium sp.]